jgi:hypothetical protein
MVSFPYIDEEGVLNVEATKIDDIHMYFECPRCVYRKRPVIHFHGSSGQYHNRVEHRVGHCNPEQVKHYEDNQKGFYIHITENTDFKAKGKSRIYSKRPSPLII